MMTIDEKFYKYHLENPHVYEALVELARKAKDAGQTKTSIEFLVNIFRWNLILETKGDDGYKFNNNYKSRYARLIMQKESDLKGFFELRKTA